METWEAITSRRNVRSYRDEALPREGLDRILEADRPPRPTARPDRRPFEDVVHAVRW